MALSLDSLWIPNDASNANLTFSSINCGYREIDGLMFVFGRFTYPSTGNGNAAKIGGLPAPVVNSLIAQNAQVMFSQSAAAVIAALPLANSSTFQIINASSGASITNSQLSGGAVSFFIGYPAGVA